MARCLAVHQYMGADGTQDRRYLAGRLKARVRSRQLDVLGWCAAGSSAYRGVLPRPSIMKDSAALSCLR